MTALKNKQQMMLVDRSTDMIQKWHILLKFVGVLCKLLSVFTNSFCLYI